MQIAFKIYTLFSYFQNKAIIKLHQFHSLILSKLIKIILTSIINFNLWKEIMEDFFQILTKVFFPILTCTHNTLKYNKQNKII